MKWAILTLISIFICWCCGNMLEWDSAGNLIAHSYSVWGDWSAHFTFISNLMNRGPSWIAGNNPVFFGMPFQYPFLSHLITAFVAFITGMNVVNATYYTSLVLLFCLPFALFYFFNKIGLTRRQALVGTVLFLFLGGLQAFDSSLNPNEPWTNQFKSGSVFTQIVLFELFPQRAFLFGMIILLLGIPYCLKRFSSNTFTRTAAASMTLLFALLSWTHLHSWIAVGTLLLFYFLFIFFRRRENSLKPLYFGMAVMVASAPLIYFLLLRTNFDNVTNSAASLNWQKWFPGWAQNPAANLYGAQEFNPVSFWIYNTGIFLPLALFGAIRLFKNRNNSVQWTTPLLTLSSAGLFLFGFAELVNIQPYFYDNLKIFTYAFLFLTPVAAIGIDWFFEKKAWLAVGLLLIGTQVYTATQDYLFFKDQRQGTPFLTHEEFELAKQFQSLRRSPNSLVLMAPKHNHWLTTLAGNPVLMGYPGWLWTWGISYQSREAELNEILTGGPRAREILQKYPIEYVIVSDHDQVAQRPVSISFFREQFTPLFESGVWHVFKVR